MKLFHLYPEGGPAPPMTSSICVFHLGISLVVEHRLLHTRCNVGEWWVSNPFKNARFLDTSDLGEGNHVVPNLVSMGIRHENPTLSSEFFA